MSDKHFKTSDGIELHYTDHGPADGTPVLLVHGLAAGGRQFEADALYFADRGFRVLVPDLRGHGTSGAPPVGAHERFSIERIGEDMAELLDWVGTGPVHWVGNSLGGIIALPLLRGKPELFSSFACFGTTFRLDLPRVTPHLLPLPTRLLGRKLSGWSTARITTRERSAWPLIAGLVGTFDGKIGRAIARHVHRYDLRDDAKRFAGPMLMLRGGLDRAVNLALPDTLEAIKGKANFSLVDLPAGGHCANLDASEPWRAALLQFWAAVEAVTPQAEPGAVA